MKNAVEPPMRVFLFILPALILAAAPRAFAQDKLDLRLRFTKGDTHSMTVSLDQRIDQTVQGVAQHVAQTFNLSYTFKVDDVDDRGQATLSLHYDSIEYRVKSPAGEANYNSTQPSTLDSPLTASLATLVGQGFTFTISPEAQISQVTGLDKLSNTVLAKLSGVEGPARVAAEKVIHQQLSEPSVRASLQNLFAPLPDHPVAIGESWSRPTQANQSFALTLETTCTLRSRDNGIATIEISSHASTLPNSILDLGQTKFAYNLLSESHGQIQIQESTGWTTQVTSTQSLAGNTVTQSPNSAPQNVPLAIESKLNGMQK